ncbi:aminopeptidase [Amedibacillus dolichus]|uniref:M18 family aminopeptidase n=1 Tax=Amedibacillus dolichus TaxID=31971 RepID=A0ABT7UES0_9FIRM|nr:aminopeptidase [Amedibacillus dolichus]MDM8157453.1 aminopeptidase [Amedibacillus dolichus]
MSEKNVWETYEEQEMNEVFALAEDYKRFISENKTERACVKSAVAMAEARGYRDLRKVIRRQETLKPQDKVYLTMMEKSIVLFHLGDRPLEEGMHILGAHIDSPRLDLKQNPVYENTELAYLDTHYYGGIKKYQWVTLPLALHGVIVKKDGTSVDVCIGEKEDDPVFVISDLLIHLSNDQMQKKAASVIEGEDLNVTFGSMPLKEEEKDKVKANVLKLLKERYDVEESDLVSAEIEVVPAGKARDLGIDRSMVIGYGQDDRVCAYTSLVALLEMENVEKTAVCLLVDKEEVGSQGATGMQSCFFENALAEVMDRMGIYSELKVRRALQHSKMLSSDVSAAYDPNYAGVMETNNCAYFGKGLVFNKYTGARGKSGCNDANAEYMAELRAVMEKGNVAYQTSELGKVDQGGGGTIAYILANYGMEVIDSGVALHNMHAPWEVSSKADIYEAKKGYLAFLKYAG